MKCVLRLGGSILFPDFNITQQDIWKYIEVMEQVGKQTSKLLLVVGGGAPARYYIKLAKNIASSYTRDELGIQASRLNASLVREFLSHLTDGIDIAPSIPHSAAEIRNLYKSYDTIVCGGFRPGHSTTGVAALTAEAINADLLAIATDVNGIYEGNPKEQRQIKKYDTIKIHTLIQLLASNKATAGTYELLDLLTLKIIERSKIPTFVFDGTAPKNIQKVISAYNEGKSEPIKELGTIVKYS